MQPTAAQYQKLIAGRRRGFVSYQGRAPSWWQFIHYQIIPGTANATGADIPFVWAVESTADASRIHRLVILDPHDFGRSEVQPVEVAPLDFGSGNIIRADHHGHNAIAEAVALLAAHRMPATFRYRKPGHSPEQRNVLVTWADGHRFGGEDYDRDHADRSFRLDRVLTIALAGSATKCPVWSGEAYEAGLP